jgi:hypothetical protein
MPRAFLCHESDNVATMLDDASNESVQPGGACLSLPVQALGAIPQAHKIALRAIPANTPVIKYGVPIGIATRDIQPGEWVHLHNCRSQLDERSSKFEGGSEQNVESKYA